jgi:hypothetical protein
LCGVFFDESAATHLENGGVIAIQGGADPWTTLIDLTSIGLTATDSAATLNTGGIGKLRVSFSEPTGTGNDNLQIDASGSMERLFLNLQRWD